MASEWSSAAVRAFIDADATTSTSHAFILNSCRIEQAAFDCHQAFSGPHFIHAFAVKANPLSCVLDLLVQSGMALETASIAEFEAARRALQRAKFDTSRIIFDSPAKTLQELRIAVYSRCYLNIDNFQELERVAQLHVQEPVTACIGIRINPQVGAGKCPSSIPFSELLSLLCLYLSFDQFLSLTLAAGSIAALSTGVSTSKFGIGLDENREGLLAAFRQYPFLKMVHVHTGSQGLSLDVMVDAIKKVAAFAQELGPQVTVFDIGGGLSVNFKSDEISPTFAQYSAALQAQVPMLFDGSYIVITEFGRSIVAKAGALFSRVEYTKVAGGRFIIQQHCGHDLLVRTVWCPQVWPLRLLVFNGSNGNLRTDDLIVSDVAGTSSLFHLVHTNLYVLNFRAMLHGW
jgi:diaminopimelate decarboxylase